MPVGAPAFSTITRTCDGAFVGVVTAIGPRVTEHRVGDRVGGFVRGGCWGTFVTCDARLAAPLPSGLSEEDAAAVSSAYSTAWYGLVDLARLKACDRVLIHSATGGVGLAAIALARAAGAEVIATAGSLRKRQWLREEHGLEYVFDSRSNGFYDQAMRATQETALRATEVAQPALGAVDFKELFVHTGREVPRSGADDSL